MKKERVCQGYKIIDAVRVGNTEIVLGHRDGGKRRSAEVIADNVYFGDSKPREDDAEPPAAPDSYLSGGFGSEEIPDNFMPNFD